MTALSSKITMALVFLCACGGDDIQDTAKTSLSNIEDNGITLNGITLNGITLNGITLNGITLNGITLNGVTLNGNSLTGRRGDSGAKVSGKDMVGATMKTELSDGNTAVVRVDDTTYDTASGLYLYSVSVAGDDGWTPICGTANGSPIPAVPVPGKWDPVTGAHVDQSDSFTYACENAAIGKCVIWGYHPWETKKECDNGNCQSQSLSNWLEACTRLVRADYCGNGVPHTRNGTQINVWDSLGIQLETKTSWSLEAEWAVDGAHCIRHTRWVRSNETKPGTPTDMDYVVMNCRDRLAASGKEDCGYQSDFFTKKGLAKPLDKRKLLRNESALNR